jgi:dihydrofolate reductase
MRKVSFGGAMSLDGFIAGPNGEHDWIVMDPAIDFAEMMGRFDTFLVGRKTFDAMRRMGSDMADLPDAKNIVFSRTMKPADYPQLTISDDAERTVAELRATPGKDIALFGGGELFRSLLAAGLVDEVGVSIIPVLLGGGNSTTALPGRAHRSSAAQAAPLREDGHHRALVRHQAALMPASCG